MIVPALMPTITLMTIIMMTTIILILPVVSLMSAALPTLPTAPVNLLLQHDAVHARLEQRKHEAGLALQLAQAVEDVGGGRCG